MRPPVQPLVAAVATPILLAQALHSTRYAARHSGPGVEFAKYGRRIGMRLLCRDPMAGLSLLLTPVNIVRYWEFPFVLANLPESPGRCLDVASPRLFSYYVAQLRDPASIRILNPDRRDATTTSKLAANLGLRSISVDQDRVEALRGSDETFDSIWSISVLEHMAGEGDREAMGILWQLLRPGGRLLFTVPVDREPWDEFRSEDVYALGLEGDARGYFFQRWYDAETLSDRLLSGLDRASVVVRWFGERTPGRYSAYECDWMRRGHARTVDDPREIVDHYAEFPTWDSMPGQGVVGIVIEKSPR